MSRKARTDGKTNVTLHIDKGHRYASTQPAHVDPGTGKVSYTRVHWGTVSEDLVFTPNNRFKAASNEERKSLVFPPDWDTSAIGRLEEEEGKRAEKLVNGAGRPSYVGEDLNRFYGDIWLLENIAEKIGLTRDLVAVFDGDKETAAKILALSIFLYTTNYSLNRVERWQRIATSPTDANLSASAITVFTQAITEQDRMDLFGMRKDRLQDEDFLAVDSTSFSHYGTTLTDIEWGKNKEGDNLPQTNELVVYALASHMPVYYRELPGNSPDTRALEVLITELHHAGFNDTPMIFDRGYASESNIGFLCRRNLPFIICCKTNWSVISSAIEALGVPRDGLCPTGFTLDRKSKFYHTQRDITWAVRLNSGDNHEYPLRLNLYYDPVRRLTEIRDLDIAVLDQCDDLQKVMDDRLPTTSAEAKRCYPYYNVTLAADGKVGSFSRNERKIASAMKVFGYIAFISCRVEGDSAVIWDYYHMRDEQEKMFMRLKTQMGARRTRAWSEEANEGRLFINFVSLSLGAYLHSVWKNTSLKKEFCSSLEILDEMRPIRCIEHTRRAKKITPFIGAQLEIADVFGFEPPIGCRPASQKKKRTRAKKQAKAKPVKNK
jgi:hypothetical protein